MNHKLSAKIHKLPFCPECLVPRLAACVNPNGTTRAPHRVRELVVAGLVVVKRSRRWWAMRKLEQATAARSELVDKIDRRGKRKPGESAP
jgi:hypothetical protein